MVLLSTKPVRVVIGAGLLALAHGLTHMLVSMALPGNMNAQVFAAGFVVFFGYITLRYSEDK